MHGTLRERISEARQIERTLVRGDARVCSSNFGKVCKALWPHKTAEELALRAQCGTRAAAYELSGEREPSARSLLAVMAEITPKRMP